MSEFERDYTPGGNLGKVMAPVTNRVLHELIKVPADYFDGPQGDQGDAHRNAGAEHKNYETRNTGADGKLAWDNHGDMDKADRDYIDMRPDFEEDVLLFKKRRRSVMDAQAGRRATKTYRAPKRGGGKRARSESPPPRSRKRPKTTPPRGKRGRMRPHTMREVRTTLTSDEKHRHTMCVL